MNLYDLVFESIQTKYENGELTLEQANEVNDLAYEKYVSEGNAYNKYMNMKQDEYDKLKKKADVLEKLGDNGKLKADVLRNKAKKIAEKIQDETEPSGNNNGYIRLRINKDVEGANDGNLYKKHGDKNGGSNNGEAKELKKAWMERHGDKGEFPEKKLVGDRYLNAKKELDKINKK